MSVTNGIDPAQWLRLARSLAKMCRRPGERRDEVMSVAYHGLVHAAKNWKPDQGGKFVTYAWMCIIGHIRNWRANESAWRHCRFRVNGKLPEWVQRRGKRTLVLFSELGRDYVHGYGESLAVDNGAEQRLVDILDAQSIVYKFWDRINSRDQHLLMMMYGLHTGEPMSCRQVAHEMGISAQRVCQIEERALAKLGDLLRMVHLDVDA